MKKKIIYFLIAVIGTVGFNSCGPFGGTQDRTGTGTGTETGTTTGTTGTVGDGTETSTGTTGERTRTTGTTGDRTGTTTGTTTGTVQDQQDSTFELDEPTAYSYENEDYRFSPDDRGINISRVENGRETDYGTARSVGDGYYLMNRTSPTGDDETAIGRFDDQGNFTVHRYDRDRDEVVEETFRTQNTMNSERRN